LIALALIGLAGPAAADDAASAKRYYLSGSKHFDLGEYAEALNDFKEGYRLKDDPVFLYNIAQCYRLLDQNTEALRAYKNYLRRAPNASNRVEVERKIAAIEEAQAAAQKASTTPPNQVIPPGPPPPESAPPTGTPAVATPAPGAPSVTATAPTREQRQPVYKKWWLWTVVGVVVVGAAVGLGVGLGTAHASAGPTVYPAVQF